MSHGATASCCFSQGGKMTVVSQAERWVTVGVVVVFCVLAAAYAAIGGIAAAMFFSKIMMIALVLARGANPNKLVAVLSKTIRRMKE